MFKCSLKKVYLFCDINYDLKMSDNNDSNKSINVSKDSNINVNFGVNSATFGIISFVIGIIGIFLISLFYHH